jgi:seryl-tRNA synthetase
MLDPKLLREQSKIVKESMKKRGIEVSVIDNWLHLDSKLKELRLNGDELKHDRNMISQKINEYKKLGDEKSAKEAIRKAQELPEKIKKIDAEIIETEAKLKEISMNLPNLVDKSVPVGDASKNKTIFVSGKPKKMAFEPKGHEELLVSLDQLDLERAAKVSGARFYYLKNEIARLNYAIISFALDFLRKKKFSVVQPPYMLKKEALEGALPFAAFGEMIYKIENEDLYLIGTAEHALNAYYMNEVLNTKDMPVRFAGVSPCFRKEAGSHGKDTKGIFRIHQFEKIEQFVFCRPEDSWKEFEMILSNSKELLKQLEIPFRFVVLSSQDMGRVPTKTIDFEGWFPSQKGYRELGSCSNCLDYQARRSNIKYDEKGERKFVNTLNNTAIATERMIACIAENHQQKDGSIKVPKSLWKYCGFKEIRAKKQ